MTLSVTEGDGEGKAAENEENTEENLIMKKYLITAKLSFSTSLLYNCDMSIAEISQRLGYSNQSNYVNEFKKYYRIAPSRYRKLHTSKIND